MTITSANTSVNKNRPPAILKLIEKVHGWRRGTVHYDLGCGKYPEIIAKALNKRGVVYIGTDPYNRKGTDNQTAFRHLNRHGGADTASISNVLNVIKDKRDRITLYNNAYRELKEDGVLYIVVYEGDKSGQGRITKKDCWQNNKKTEDYQKEIASVFQNVKRKGKLIIAKKTKEF